MLKKELASGHRVLKRSQISAMLSALLIIPSIKHQHSHITGLMLNCRLEEREICR